ncbi:hypothetical protein HMPREF1554_01109 [Porphyromonas gingivalis F0569]|nr:hypothetical protein HMPREF1554_01109 [Porphyromonas gingivalis F0569]
MNHIFLHLSPDEALCRKLDVAAERADCLNRTTWIIDYNRTCAPNTFIPSIFPADPFAPITYHAISIFGQTAYIPMTNK